MQKTSRIGFLRFVQSGATNSSDENSKFICKTNFVAIVNGLSIIKILREQVTEIEIGYPTLVIPKPPKH